MFGIFGSQNWQPLIACFEEDDMQYTAAGEIALQEIDCNEYKFLTSLWGTRLCCVICIHICKIA